MNDDERWRVRARTALQDYFRRRSAPRLILSAILILTGSAGLVVSVALLRFGLERMWIRYPVAVFAAYGVFLGLIRLWVEFEKSRFDPQTDAVQKALKEAQAKYEPSWSSGHDTGSWFDWLDIPNVFDFDEGCLPVLLVAALIGVLALLVITVLAAPALAAEVFIDAFVVSVLYRQLRKAAQENWLGTAVKKTWIRALGVGLLLSLIGWVLEILAPGSHSIGPAIQKLLGS
jgi:hypothetical protein